MFVALSRFTIQDHMTDAVRAACDGHSELLQRAQGCVGTLVLSPQEASQEVWRLTHWVDEASYCVWQQACGAQESSEDIPQGLALVPRSVEIRHFDVLAPVGASA